MVELYSLLDRFGRGRHWSEKDLFNINLLALGSCRLAPGLRVVTEVKRLEFEVRAA